MEMNSDKKDILLHLYGESPEGKDLRSLLQDESLREEHAELSEAKFRLDHRPKLRPDAAVMDAILQAAAQPDTEASSQKAPLLRKPDRPAFSRSKLRKVLIPALSMAAVVVVAIGFGMWGQPNTSLPTGSASLRSDDVVPPESLFRYVPPKQQVQLAGSRDARLSWDDGSSLTNLHNRIQRLNEGGPSDWGTGALPLEVLPGSSNPSIRTTGSNN